MKVYVLALAASAAAAPWAGYDTVYVKPTTTPCEESVLPTNSSTPWYPVHTPPAPSSIGGSYPPYPIVTPTPAPSSTPCPEESSVYVPHPHIPIPIPSGSSWVYPIYTPKPHPPPVYANSTTPCPTTTLHITIPVAGTSAPPPPVSYGTPIMPSPTTIPAVASPSTSAPPEFTGAAAANGPAMAVLAGAAALAMAL